MSEHTFCDAFDRQSDAVWRHTVKWNVLDENLSSFWRKIKSRISQS